MTDRRRNLFVLLFVAALVLASGALIATKKTKLGLDLRGGVQLIYQLKPNAGEKLDADTVERTIDVMTKRVNSLGVAEAEVQRSGTDQVEVSLPGDDNPEAAERTVGTTGQLTFFDWEATVVGPQGQPEPTNGSVNGFGTQGAAGAAARPPALTRYAAIELGKKLKPQKLVRGSVGEQWYLVDTKAKTVINKTPESTKADLEQSRELAGLKKRLGGDLQKGDREFVKVPTGYRVVQADVGGSTTPDKIDSYYLLRDTPTLTGADIKGATDGVNTRGVREYIVSFDFNSSGRKAWEATTKAIAQRGSQNCSPGAVGAAREACFNHFAVVLDGRLITVPSISFVEFPNGLAGDGGSQISGSFTAKSARELANLLKAGSLPVTLEQIGSQQVSATLGAEALDKGLFAAGVGFVIIALFLILFYRALGLIAVVGLGVYSVLFFALIKLIPIVLTLPGIAGLVLTIAVAADANVVIFERVKDELAAGRSVPRAVKEGYQKGLSAILDGNLVTFLVAFVLFMIATASVKGFALALGLGVIVSMITAVVLTQAILGVAASTSLLSNPRLLGARSRLPIWHRFDFVGASKWFFAISGVILAIGAFAIGGKGLNLGIDFESGTQIAATAKDGVTVEDIRKITATVGEGQAKVQQVQQKGANATKSTNTFQIVTRALDQKQISTLKRNLEADAGVTEANLSVKTVGPTFGKTVAKLAIFAVLASLLLIGAVVWLRFGIRYTVPILIALMHDILITAGVYALLGAEVTNATVAALLTILGYSIYDTVIVFDRVRENLKRLPSAAFSQIVNRSMSEVLGRSLVTSFSTGLPTLALLLFGGDTLQDFALAMLVGTISGAYSSVFIASPILTEWVERVPAFRRRKARLAAANGGIVPPYPESRGKEVDPFNKKPSKRITAPDTPDAVSEQEFQQMVDSIGGPELTSEQASRAERRASERTPERSVDDAVLPGSKPGSRRIGGARPGKKRKNNRKSR